MTTIETLNPAIELAKQMILAGTLQKNVVRHFTNRGFTLGASENICELGVFRAEEYLKNKTK